MKKRHEQKLIILSLLMLLVLNIPLVLLFDDASAVLGFPIFYLHIFSAWSCSVLISYIIIKRYYE